VFRSGAGPPGRRPGEPGRVGRRGAGGPEGRRFAQHHGHVPRLQRRHQRGGQDGPARGQVPRLQRGHGAILLVCRRLGLNSVRFSPFGSRPLAKSTSGVRATACSSARFRPTESPVREPTGSFDNSFETGHIY